MNKYYIRYEVMGSDYYYMIYRKSFFGLVHQFYERWNTPDSAISRCDELNKETYNGLQEKR